jgi:hypothetical protein
MAVQVMFRIKAKALPGIPPDRAATKILVKQYKPLRLWIPAANLLLFPVTFRLVGKFKCNPPVFIELQRGIELFARLAFEALDEGSLAFGQQVRDLSVGQLFLANIAENDQSAFFVRAFGHFGIKRVHVRTVIGYRIIL